jgi:hypothetical protein
MKRALILLTAIVTITACQSAQNPNANNAAGNQNANRITVDTDENRCEPGSGQQVVREIIIEPYNNTARIRRPVDDISITLKDHQHVDWCINNSSTIAVRLVIFNLRMELSPQDKNPFGDGSSEKNNFGSKKIRPGKVKNLKTDEAFKAGTYKYDILLTDDDGGYLDSEDPQVVISDGRPREISGNSNVGLRNANAGNKNKK